MAVALTVVAADQASKFLAVSGLTNGIQRAAASAGVSDPGLVDRIGFFYASVSQPSHSPACS